jgi:hypothetical protein
MATTPMNVTPTLRPRSEQRGVGIRISRNLGLCLAGAWLFGCAHLGPGSVMEDRFDYSTAIAESWKQQTLLNIVKLRYMDLPVFVEVASIVAGYSLQAGVNVGGTNSSAKAIQGNFVAVGAQAIYTDRPTITYAPLTGDKFLRGLITPIDPKNIFFMLQSGYAADFVLGLTVESLNGVRNRSVTANAVREADPDFVRALQLMREVQLAGDRRTFDITAFRPPPFRLASDDTERGGSADGRGLLVNHKVNFRTVLHAAMGTSRSTSWIVFRI